MVPTAPTVGCSHRTAVGRFTEVKSDHFSPRLSDPASTKGTTETLHQFRVRSNVKWLDAFMLLFEWNQMIMPFAGVLLYWMHMFSSWDVKLRIPHTSIMCSYVLWQQTENMLTIYQIFYQVHTCKLNYYLCFPINPIIYYPAHSKYSSVTSVLKPIVNHPCLVCKRSDIPIGRNPDPALGQRPRDGRVALLCVFPMGLITESDH